MIKRSQVLVHFVRHASSVWNEAPVHYPDPLIWDAPLSAYGENQAIAASDHSLEYTTVVSSALTRAIQTALLMFPDATHREVWRELNEVQDCSGDMMSPKEHLLEQFPELSAAIRACPDIPSGSEVEEERRHYQEFGRYETVEQAAERVDRALERIKAVETPTLVVVAHSDFLHLMIKLVTGDEVYLPNCGVHSAVIEK